VNVQEHIMSSGQRRFESKSVLVTGGSTGIGRATAVAFGREGAGVAIGDLDEAESRETVRLIEAVGGAIVNTASVAGVIADPNMAPYVAAKHGVVGLTRAPAVEYSRQSVRVNAIAPGGVRTQMIGGWLAAAAFTQELTLRHAIGHLVEPEEMSEAVLFLCSPGASFITGHALVVDGGLTVH
jgi:NAD(P)-dependent dehydrogenase (short-subunit alcohol dehydrogenase family)